MTFKDLTIYFAEGDSVHFPEPDLLAVAMNGFLVVAVSEDRYYYNLETIISYTFKEKEDEEKPNPRDNLHVIN